MNKAMFFSAYKTHELRYLEVAVCQKNWSLFIFRFVAFYCLNVAFHPFLDSFIMKYLYFCRKI